MRIAALLATVWLVSVGISSAQGRLIDAVRANDAGAVRTLLDARADANSVQPDGTTALHWAVERDAIEIVQLLIRAGANVKATNRYGATPLWLASLNGNAATIGVLLEAGADPSAASDEGETALMVAARTGKIDAVNLLLARGADPNVKEQWRGQTALMWAAAEGYAPVIETLVARGADVGARSNGGFTAILFAAREGRIAAVDALIKAGADMNDSLPIRKRPPQNAPAPPPDPGPNAFLLAAANAHYELAAWLLDRGTDPNAAPQGFTALHQVSWVRKAGIAGSNNPAPQGSGTMDSLTFVRTLVAKGATLDTRVTKKPNMGVTTLNSIGATPFLLAARTADAPLMKLLAELGANPLLTNEDGSTPLMVAAGVGTNAPGEDPGTEPEVLDAVRVALDLGNDLNVVDKNGETAMHGAAYKHVPTVVHYLADKGARADVWNRPNSKGWTPLKIAEGVQRGMNIVSSPVTATAIRQVLAASSPAVQ
ncbi:MAG TPA: ankyrin repeat domain-containing protein [Vicinamibacterales bacterium]|nr:ankyrin repeat domain-containing protein [Vicinamibacterales bacterium]